MITVEVYSKSDCHLCEAAETTLKRVQARYPFELKIITLQEGDPRFEEFKERFPVIAIDHQAVFEHRVSEREFISRLKAAGRKEAP